MTWKQRLTIINKHKVLYFLVLPGLLYFLIFKYIPILGTVIAFQDYNIFRGFTKSDWVGLEHFKRMIEYRDFLRILKNTLLINLYDLLFSFTTPIFLALLLIELRKVFFKVVIRTVVFMPFFFFWVLFGVFFFIFLFLSTGFFIVLL